MDIYTRLHVFGVNTFGVYTYWVTVSFLFILLLRFTAPHHFRQSLSSSLYAIAVSRQKFKSALSAVIGLTLIHPTSTSSWPQSGCGLSPTIQGSFPFQESSPLKALFPITPSSSVSGLQGKSLFRKQQLFFRALIHVLPVRVKAPKMTSVHNKTSSLSNICPSFRIYCSTLSELLPGNVNCGRVNVPECTSYGGTEVRCTVMMDEREWKCSQRRLGAKKQIRL